MLNVKNWFSIKANIASIGPLTSDHTENAYFANARITVKAHSENVHLPDTGQTKSIAAENNCVLSEWAFGLGSSLTEFSCLATSEQVKLKALCTAILSLARKLRFCGIY